MAVGVMDSPIVWLEWTGLYMSPWKLIGLTGAFLVTDTWATLSVIGVVYIAVIPVSVFSFRRLKYAAKPHADAIDDEPKT